MTGASTSCSLRWGCKRLEAQKLIATMARNWIVMVDARVAGPSKLRGALEGTLGAHLFLLALKYGAVPDADTTWAG